MKKRIVYFDYLRLAATVAVVLIHVASFCWYDFDSDSFRWNVLNFYLVAVRWAVPVFVMLSGALFLSRDTDISQLYKKNILRLVVAYFAWSVFYALALIAGRWLVYEEFTSTFGSVVLDILGGYYHMWFLPMIVGLYMCVPVIRQIVINKKVARYFLALAFVFAYALPQLIQLCRDFTGGWLLDLANQVDAIVSYEVKISLVLGYTAYFILGYLLEEATLTKKQRTLVYSLGAVGFVASVALNSIVSWKTGEPCSTYFEPFCVNTLLVVTAVHTLFKYRDYPHEKRNRLVSALARCSFGAYLVHAFVLDTLGMLGLDATLWHPLISIPAITLIAAVLSFGISWVIHKLPVLNQWVV